MTTRVVCIEINAICKYYKIKKLLGGVEMNVLIYGTTQEKELIIQHMKSQTCMAFRLLHFTQTEDYDEFVDNLQKCEPDLIYVTKDNAAGMEGVIAVKNLYPDTPVVWFSNDKNFVAQSYRLGVDYFSVKPIDEKMMNLAITRCQRREEMAI